MEPRSSRVPLSLGCGGAAATKARPNGRRDAEHHRRFSAGNMSSLLAWGNQAKRRSDELALDRLIGGLRRGVPIGGREDGDHDHLPAVANRAFTEGLAGQFFVEIAIVSGVLRLDGTR